MSSTDASISGTRNGSRAKFVVAGVVAAVIAGIAVDTHVVPIGSEQDLRQQGFNATIYGQQEFPRIRENIATRAVNAPQLAAEIAEDQATAVARHGVGDGIGPVIPVRFTGIIGEGRSGIHDVTIDGLPDGVRVRVQTGPAINGTELRDATGDISFGQFRNQIEYQDAGSALNRAMASEVLADLNRDTLEGSTVTVTGAFRLINPANWLVTPIELVLQ